MANITGASGDSGDLFGDTPIPGRDRAILPRSTSELTRARVLCRQLRRKRARADKMRIAHLICLNLLSMLRQTAQRRWRISARTQNTGAFRVFTSRHKGISCLP